MLSHHEISFCEHRKRTAFWLSLFLGVIGAHRFYLHQKFAGIAYLLFCWTLVPLILGVIDAVFIAQMSDEEFSEEFNEVPRLAA